MKKQEILDILSDELTYIEDQDGNKRPCVEIDDFNDIADAILRLSEVSRSLPSWQEIMLEGEQEANKRHLGNTELAKIRFLEGWRLACKYLGKYYIKR